MTTTRLQVETVPISDLHLDPSNARRHGARNLTAIQASLTRFGQQKPIVIDPDGTVVAGNGTVEAAQSLGWTTIAVVRTTLEQAERLAYAIADNRSSELADWDEPALAALLQGLDAELREAAGYLDEDLAALLAALAAEIPTLEDPGPEAPPANPVSRRGDLWRLGDHRLLCGDATNPRDLARLMARETAALLATVP